MNIKEKAMYFAIQSHKGQTLNGEPDKCKFMHLISVAKILETYHYSDYIVAAAYLHEVIEDTKYSFNFTRKDMINKIEREFGKYICSLIQGTSEIPKSLSWRERKQRTIDEIRKLPFENKVIICADKINHLEDLYLTFEKNGKRDFYAFHSGEQNQRWYYTQVYESLIDSVDENLPIFRRLKSIIDKVFPASLSDFLLNANEKEVRLRKLTASVLEVKRLKALNQLERPFVVEFTGMPRTFEHTAVQDLFNFFSSYGFKVTLLNDITKSSIYNTFFGDSIKKLSKEKIVQATSALQYNQFLGAIQPNRGTDIVLAERSIVDMQLRNYVAFQNFDIPIENYQQICENSIDSLIVSCADTVSVIRKDYNGLTEEEEKIQYYNDALLRNGYCKDFGKSCHLIETTLLDADCFALEAAESIMPDMRKKYIKSFNNRYKCNSCK